MPTNRPIGSKDPKSANPPGLGYGDYGHKDFLRAHGKAPMAAAQQANLDAVGSAGDERADEYARMAGLNEQQQQEEHYQVNQTQAILKMSMQETSWQHAITQLGFDEATAMRMLADTKNQEETQRRHYTNLVTTIAKLVVTYYTGGLAGGALSSTAVAGSTGSATGVMSTLA